MTVDADGNVWSARWDGYCLTQYAPDGRELQRIKFPTKKVSSVIFGGPDYKDMYVTTAGGHNKEENGPTAGALYRPNLAHQDYSLTRIVYDREERSRLAIEQGRFAEEHFIKPHAALLARWSAAFAA